MKYILSPFFLLIFVSHFSIAQQTIDTIYLNKNWQKATHKNYEYYRISAKTDFAYQISNYYKNGKVQMRATYLSLEPEIKDGICTWYTKSGKIKEVVQYSKYKSDDFHYFEQSRIIENAYKNSLKNKSIDSLQHFINSNKISDTGLFALAYSRKAMALSKINSKEIRGFVKGEKSNFNTVNDILDSYKTALDVNDVCKLSHQVDRMQFLKSVNDTTLLYKNDLKELKSKGYQEEFGSFDIGINFMKGNYNWLGADVSLITYNGERWRSKNDKNQAKQFVVPFSMPFKMGFMNVSFLKNLSNSDYDVSFSLFQLTSPMVVNITKFGYQKNRESGLKYWYYRPEIGLGWNSFSVYYSYNCMFKKQSSPFIEKHLLNLRIAIPVLKWK